MENVNAATARLRRTFQYPPDDDAGSTDSPGEALDEEEQEQLIHTLADENAARNRQFRQLLLALPLVAALAYVPALLRPSAFLLALLGLSSLLSTAYLVHRLPPPQTGIWVLDQLYGGASAATAAAAGAGGFPASPSSLSAAQRRRRRSRSSSFSVPLAAQAGSPLERYLPYMNLALCGILLLMGLLTAPHSHEARWGRVSLGGLPCVVYGVVLLAKVVMAGVDPEAELEGLRYEYKGA